MLTKEECKTLDAFVAVLLHLVAQYDGKLPLTEQEEKVLDKLKEM